MKYVPRSQAYHAVYQMFMFHPNARFSYRPVWILDIFIILEQYSTTSLLQYWSLLN